MILKYPTARLRYVTSDWLSLGITISLGMAAGPFEAAQGQTLAPPFSTNYSLVVLGSAPNVPGPYGGVIFLTGDPNTLLIGGASAQSGGQLYSIKLQRDGNGHVIGLQGTATLFASAPFNNGGLAYATNGVLLVARSDKAVGEIKPGSTSFNKVVDLGAVGVTNSPGGIGFVPPGFPGAGQLKVLGNADAEFYAATFGLDGTGTLNITGVRSEAQLLYHDFLGDHSREPKPFVYLPPGKSGFADYSTIVVCEADGDRGLIGFGAVGAYQVDADGAPIPGTRQELLTTEWICGVAADPVTGDLLFSTFSSGFFGGSNVVFAVRARAGIPTRIISLGGNLAFGSVTVGATAQSTLTITNSGNATLTVSAISYPAGFTGNWASGTIPAGGAQNVTVTFAPTLATNYSGGITVTADATSGNGGIAVSGGGVRGALSVSPNVITNDYPGSLHLHLSGLTNGQTVLVETFLDLSNSGTIASGDPLYQSFLITDGAVPVLGGITNVNVPFDEDGAANGQITVEISLRGDFGMGKTTGNYLCRVSDLSGGFGPLVTSYRVEPATYPQGVAGTLLDSTTAGPVPGAVVALLELSSVFGSSGALDLSETRLVGSGFTDSQGRFTVYCPPGLYLALALRVGYYAVLPVNDLAAIFSALVEVNANQWTAHATAVTPGNLSISGRLTSSRSGGGLPGIMLFAIGQATNGLDFAFSFTDAQGSFQMPVGSGQWSLMLPPLALARLGCVAVTNVPAIDTSTGSVTGVSLIVPAATNLIYGRLASVTGAPLAGVRLDAVSSTATNCYTSTFTDTNGQYVLGVFAGGWELRPDAQAVDTMGYEQQVALVTVSKTPAVLENITFQPIPSPDAGTLSWHWQNPLPQGNNLAGVAAGNGVFVAVGDRGTVLRSANGRQWEMENSGTDAALNAVIYANGRFVAVGGADDASTEYGVVVASTNGVAWEPANPGPSGQLQAITFAQNLFVAVGDNGISTSPDGLNWQTRMTGGAGSWLRVVAFGNGVFVTGGDNYVVLTSTDGVKWTGTLTNDQAMTSLAFGGGNFVAGVGNGGPIMNVLVSTNGVAWTSQRADAYAPAALLWYQGTFYGVGGSGGAVRSADGINWTAENLPPPVNSFAFSALAAANGTFVGAGRAGAIAYSPDGTNWLAASSGATVPFKDIAFGQGLFAAADNQGRIFISKDGNAWTPAYARNGLGVAEFSRVFHAGGMFFATGGAGTIASQDGQHWWPDEPLGAVSPSGITYGNGQFIAVGSQGAFRSSDGLHWQAPSPGLTNALASVVYGNGMFIAADSSTFWVSGDGLNWSAKFNADTLQIHSLQDLAFSNDRFVAVDYQGGAVVSSDGTNWTAAITPPVGQLRRIASAVGNFVAVGDDISVSVDGLHWTKVRFGVPLLGGIAYGNRYLVAVGDNGAMLKSDAVQDQAPIILTQPQSHTVTPGVGLTLSVNAQSSSPLSYQWSKDGQPIAGATIPSLLLPGVQARDAGEYTVQISNGRAVVASDPAWVVVAAASPPNPPLEQWQRVPLSPLRTNSLFSVAHGSFQYAWSSSWNGALVAVGDHGTIFTSVNGGAWEWQFAPTSNALAGVAFGQGKFVAVGDAGTVLSSSDGLFWQQYNSGTSNLLNRVAFGGGQFLAPGVGGTLLTSTNGINWTAQNSGTTEDLEGVAVGAVKTNLLIVAVGDGHTLLSSTNGSGWISHDAGLTNDLLGATFANGQFVVVGTGGAILTSADGVAWRRQLCPVKSDLWSIIGGLGFFVTVGVDGTVLVSPDAVQWTERPAGTSATLYEVTFAEGAFWAVGDAGTVLYSDFLVGLRWLSFPDALVGLQGPPGRFYRIEATSPLPRTNDWFWETQVYVPRNSLPEGPVFLPNRSGSPQRFFRAVLLP